MVKVSKKIVPTLILLATILPTIGNTSHILDNLRSENPKTRALGKAAVSKKRAQDITNIINDKTLSEDEKVKELEVTIAAHQKPTSMQNFLGRFNINDGNSDGETPLAVAIKQGLLKVIDFLLKKDANPNHSCGTTRESPLHYATSDKDHHLNVSGNRLEIVRAHA